MIRKLFKNKHKLDLTKGNTIRNIWTLALPIMLGNILQTAFTIVDMIWVGKLGSDSIASVAMSGVVLMVIVTLGIGLSTGTQAVVARYAGRKDYQSVENVSMQSLFLGALLSVLLAIIGLTFARPILKILGAKHLVLELGSSYLKIILTGGLMIVYLFLVNAILRAAGDAVMSMFIMVGAIILNIILDPLMIFGIGFPRMGVAGAALATVISRGLAAAVGLYVLFHGHCSVRLRLSKLRVDLKSAGQILKIGFPDSVQIALRSVAGLILMAIVAKYGNYAIAAYGIGLRIFSIVLMPGFAFATSAATLVGQNLGAAQFSRAKTSAWQAAGFNTLLMGFAAVVFFKFSEHLISVFNKHPQIIKLGSDYLRITSIGYIFVAQSLVLGRSLIGAGDTVPPMLISLLVLLGIQIPLSIILPAYLHIGISGVWWAILLSYILHCLLTIYWFNLGRWQLKKI